MVTTITFVSVLPRLIVADELPEATTFAPELLRSSEATFRVAPLLTASLVARFANCRLSFEP